MKRNKERFSSGRSLALFASLALIGVGGASAAPITFAQFVQTSISQQQWTVSTSGSTTTVTASGQIEFSFANYAGLPFSSTETATFNLLATSTQLGECLIDACNSGDIFSQGGYSGNFSIIDAETVPGANLLSGIFNVAGDPFTSGARLGSTVGSSAASFRASQTPLNPTQVVFTSAYIDFAGYFNETASFGLSSLFPNFFTGPVVNGNQARPGSTFTAAGTGTFSAEAPAGVPEPGTWLLIGGGLISLGFVRRRKA